MSPSTHRNGRTQATGVVVAVVVVVAVAAGVAGVAGVVARDGQRLCALSALQSTVLCLMLNHNWIFFLFLLLFPPPLCCPRDSVVSVSVWRLFFTLEYVLLSSDTVHSSQAFALMACRLLVL